MTPFYLSSASGSSQSLEVVSSDRLSNLRTAKRIGFYVTCFNGGLVLAFLPRLFPALWIPYAVVKLSAIGYLLLIQPVNLTQEGKAMRRLCGLALAVSFFAGNWDGAWLMAHVPVLLFGSILLPLWVVALASLVGAIALSIIAFVAWRLNNAQRIAPYRDAGNPFS